MSIVRSNVPPDIAALGISYILKWRVLDYLAKSFPDMRGKRKKDYLPVYQPLIEEAHRTMRLPTFVDQEGQHFLWEGDLGDLERRHMFVNRLFAFIVHPGNKTLDEFISDCDVPLVMIRRYGFLRHKIEVL